MAQIVTITNPLTGQPAQVDQLDHTAQQIDDAIARALPGGAIDITLQNNDPRKWGLGTDSILLDSLDNALETGWYKSNAGTPGTGYWNCHAMRYNSVSVTQMATQYDNSGALIAFRMLSGSTWSPWEWLNPPMKLGVEYRTVERYLGKPVYVRLHDFGALPNSTFKEDSSPASWSIDKAICAYGTTSEGITIPTQNYAGQITTGRYISLYFSPSEIVVATDANRTNISATLFLKYTKTTD